MSGYIIPDCGVFSGAGPREWYACVRPNGHYGPHRNKSGYEWGCLHQYWDLGRCIDCFKTQEQVDAEKKRSVADPALATVKSDGESEPRQDHLVENLRGMCAFRHGGGSVCFQSARTPIDYCTPCAAASRLEHAATKFDEIVNLCNGWQVDDFSVRVEILANFARRKIRGR